jgi:predicted outer membrane lipoprotein
MRETIAWILGLAAIAAGLRALWLHHLDNQAVIRTDAVRDAFAAGQAAERTRAAEAADTARRAAYYGPPPVPDELRETALEMFRERFGRTEEEGPPELAPGWQIIQIEGQPPTVTFLPPGMEEADFVERDLGTDLPGAARYVGDDFTEPEGPGWSEWDDGYGGTSR